MTIGNELLVESPTGIYENGRPTRIFFHRRAIRTAERLIHSAVLVKEGGGDDSCFLSRLYCQDKSKMCRVILRQLDAQEFMGLDSIELAQEAHDIWWEILDALNRKFQKGFAIESDEHARRLMYRMIPFTVRWWKRKHYDFRTHSYCNTELNDGIRYISPVRAAEREYERRRFGPGGEGREKKLAQMRANAKRRWLELKNDPEKKKEYLRKRRILKTIREAKLQASKDNKERVGKLLARLTKEGIKYEKIDNGTFVNRPFEEALKDISFA
jgi:hypothetical protein